MALPPTGSGTGGLRERAGLPPSRAPAAPRPTAPARPAAAPNASPAPAETGRRTKGRRLRTALTDAEIDRQIRRLMALIANDNIDPDAPPGSYLNILL